MSKCPVLPILLTVAVAAHVSFVSAQEAVPESGPVAQIVAPTSVVSGVTGTPRPKVVMDGKYDLGIGGYAVGVYFQEYKTFTDLDAHVFYEPLIYLVTDEQGGVDHQIDRAREGAGWQLMLKFRVETDEHFITSRLRGKPMSEPRSKSLTYDHIEGELYRIMPLTIHRSYFESKRRSPLDDLPDYVSQQLSTPDRPRTFTEEDEHLVVFDFPNEAEAENFVEDINEGRDTLRFVYQFEGVSDEKCEAVFAGVQFQSGGRGQDGGGAAGEAQEEGAAN